MAQRNCHQCGATPEEQKKGLVCMVCEDSRYERPIEELPCERCEKPFMDPIHWAVEICPDCARDPSEKKAHHFFRPKGR